MPESHQLNTHHLTIIYPVSKTVTPSRGRTNKEMTTVVALSRLETAWLPYIRITIEMQCIINKVSHALSAGIRITVVSRAQQEVGQRSDDCITRRKSRLISSCRDWSHLLSLLDY